MFGRSVLALCVVVSMSLGCSGELVGAGDIEGGSLPTDVVAARAAAQKRDAAQLAQRGGSPAAGKQILFGDLHVHSTFSTDAYMMSLPILQGEGAHPVADACDYARYCSGLDFWSINDHAEALTPRLWRETKESIRQCNAVAGDARQPDVVAFLGWEWTQIGMTPQDHYGHKNVILRDIEDDAVPRRPIHSAGVTAGAMRTEIPLIVRYGPALLDRANMQYYLDGNAKIDELLAAPDCPPGVDVRELPDDCREGAATPGELFHKLDQWGFPSLVIPHGTTWGIYTPAGSSWDKQLTPEQHDPKRQTMIEVYSGHGNSEEYRSWRAVSADAGGEPRCPEPTQGYEPCCWRAGEIVRERCPLPESAECEGRVVQARRNYLLSGTAGRFSVPGAELADWRNCGSCEDCFLPSMQYRPASSVQYILGISNLDRPARPARFHFGFIASSDTHRARPGTGYKEVGRMFSTDAAGPRDESWYTRMNPRSQEMPSQASRVVDPADPEIPPYLRVDFERQASFFMTGGLAAVHSEGRSRREIWQAFERREVYGTSGPRILLWFNLLREGGATSPMGSAVELVGNPRFRVRALGSFEQLPGCPQSSGDGLSPRRLERLCRGECYHPGAERRPIVRIEVVRIRPQVTRGEDVGELIEDPWRIFACPADGSGCTVEFEDAEFASVSRPATYYVRAVEAASPAINGGGVRCRYDWQGRCVAVEPCYGDYRTPFSDECLSMVEERAWSSPIYVSATAG